jgi:DNA-binding transcriptional ArsR family regulator
LSLSPLERRILEFLNEKKKATASEMQEGIGRSLKSTYSALKMLTRLGLVRTRRSRKKGRGRPKLLYEMITPLYEIAPPSAPLDLSHTRSTVADFKKHVAKLSPNALASFYVRKDVKDLIYEITKELGAEVLCLCRVSGDLYRVDVVKFSN